jgi:sensor histidine kinase regulating citrate/malate metabolism
MIGNALENAFEACMAVKTNRFVTLTVEHNGYLLTIMVQNNFEGKVKVVGDTIFSKKSENRIGFGLQTMRSVCEKHGGMMKTEWDENVFTVLMILSHQ